MKFLVTLLAVTVSFFSLTAKDISFVYASCKLGKAKISTDKKSVTMTTNKKTEVTLYLAKSVDLSGKALKFTAYTQPQTGMGSLNIELIPKGKNSCFNRFYIQTYPGVSPLKVSLTADGRATIPFKWDKYKTKPGLLSTIKIKFYPSKAGVPVSWKIANMHTVPQALYPDKSSATYSDKPAFGAIHPIGVINPKTLAIAKENIKKYSWAQNYLRSMRATADRSYMGLSKEDIAFRIPMEDACRAVCPHCKAGSQTGFGIRTASLDFKTIKCGKCGTVYPNAKYPEDKIETVIAPNGKIKKIPYYEDASGVRYYMHMLLNYQKMYSFLYGIYIPAEVYALTGEKNYAEKTKELLLRLAETYPQYVSKGVARDPKMNNKYNTFFYNSPDRNVIHGRMVSTDKRHDACILLPALKAYTLTYNSGVYSDADKVKIENGIVRELLHSLDVIPLVSYGNENSYLFEATAFMCAAILGDTKRVHACIEGQDGLTECLKRYFYRDGMAYITFSYSQNYISRILTAIKAFNGYSDPPSYTGKNKIVDFNPFTFYPELRQAFYSTGWAMLPCGYLPPIHSTKFGLKPDQKHLGIMRKYNATPENIELFNYLGNSYALRKSIYEENKKINIPEKRVMPEKMKHSIVYPGGKLAILRRPESAKRSALVFTFPTMMGNPGNSHCQRCLLGFLFVDHGVEAVTDLGYGGGACPLYYYYYAQYIHNTVMVDGKEVPWRSYGEPRLFASESKVMALRFTAPNCYPKVTKDYTRMVFNIPLRKGRRQYLVDFFSVKGGKFHLFPFHSDLKPMTMPKGVNFTKSRTKDIAPRIWQGKWIKDVKKASVAPGCYKFSWKPESTDKLNTNFFYLPTKAVTLFTAKAPGTRVGGSYADVTKMMDLVIAKASGPVNMFMSVIESVRKGKQYVTKPKLLKTTGGAYAVEVKTIDGIDLVIWANGSKKRIKLAKYPKFSMKAEAAVVRFDKSSKLTYIWVEAGKASYGSDSVKVPAVISGKIEKISGHSLITDLSVDLKYNFSNKYMWAPSRGDGFYKLASAAVKNGKLVIELDPAEVIRVIDGDEFTIAPYCEKTF